MIQEKRWEGWEGLRGICGFGAVEVLKVELFVFQAEGEGELGVGIQECGSRGGKDRFVQRWYFRWIVVMRDEGYKMEGRKKNKGVYYLDFFSRVRNVGEWVLIFGVIFTKIGQEN